MLQMKRYNVIPPGFMDVRVYAPQAAAAPGWWLSGGINPADCYAAHQPKGAADYAASLDDLNGTNDAITGTQPDWDATNGWKFNGSTHCVKTAFVPSTDQTQSMIIQYTNMGAGNVLCGLYQATNGRFLLQKVQTYGNGQIAGSITVFPASANLCVAGSDGYRNGVSESLSIGAWGTATIRAVFIGCGGDGGSGTWHTALYIQAFALYSVTLTTAQITALAAAMAAL